MTLDASYLDVFAWDAFAWGAYASEEVRAAADAADLVTFVTVVSDWDSVVFLDCVS